MMIISFARGFDSTRLPRSRAARHAPAAPGQPSGGQNREATFRPGLSSGRKNVYYFVLKLGLCFFEFLLQISLVFDGAMLRTLRSLLLLAAISDATAFIAPSHLSHATAFSRRKMSLSNSVRKHRFTPSMVIAESAVKPPVQEQLKSSTQPKVGVWELLTKWQWGFQDPNIPLPVPVVDGQPPEVCTAVTQEHLDILARDGVVLVKGVLNKPWIDYLRAISDWQIEHPHILALPGVISNLYDYIQRTTWRTNKGFAEFMFYSPVASCLSQIAKCGWFPEGDKLGYHEIRISTDLLMVNPNKGFKWHQDEQNGPLTAGRGVDTRLDALRWWCTMDDAEVHISPNSCLTGVQMVAIAGAGSALCFFCAVL
jgi:hypothetical protein